MQKIILYRQGVAGSVEDFEELAAIRANRRLFMTPLRSGVMDFHAPLVIPRYSLWPFVAETIDDIIALGGKPINDKRSSLWLRRCCDWAGDLQEHAQALGWTQSLTPDTWSWEEYSSNNIFGPVVLKGAEKSFGHRWNTHMFARNREEAVRVYLRFMQDSAFSTEEIFVRRYEKLTELALKEAIDTNEPPVSEEYRFFVLDRSVICRGFYWSNQSENLVQPEPDPRCVPKEFLQRVIDLVAVVQPGLRLWVMDVARRVDGSWMVVELNDGCTSGLSGIKPSFYYEAISEL